MATPTVSPKIDYDYIAEAITDSLGERCPEYAEGCPTCEAWREYDRLKALDAKEKQHSV